VARTYEWTQAAREEVDPLGHPPIWWTVSASVLPLSLEAPDASDWTLERLEAYAAAGWSVINDPIGPVDPPQLIAPSIRLLAEVYPHASGSFPDPEAPGVVKSVWSAALSPDALWRDPAHLDQGLASWSTKGYVTSHGRRGPASYGGGQAQINFGLWTANCYNTLFPGVADCYFVLSARALWSRP